jgi:acetyl esterase/lipase
LLAKSSNFVRNRWVAFVVTLATVKGMSPYPFSVSFLVAIVLSCASLQGQTNAPAATPSDDIVVLHDVVFGKGGDHDLHADIAYPKNATGPLPAVIHIHGGGWVGGSYQSSSIEWLARHGYFAASIEYRLSNVAKWPAQIQDCKLSVRWLRANAAKYNVDPNRIGVWGESAGGHLVTCLGTMADVKEYEGDGGYPGVSSAVQAVVDFYGPTDFTEVGNYTPAAIRYTEMLFGTTYAQNPDLWKSGSPLYYVKAGDPPMLLVHGEADALVPIAQSTVFDAALTKANVPHQLIVVKNANHGFVPLPNTTIEPNSADINKAVMTFFYQYLKAP